MKDGVVLFGAISLMLAFIRVRNNLRDRFKIWLLPWVNFADMASIIVSHWWYQPDDGC